MSGLTMGSGMMMASMPLVSTPVSPPVLASLDVTVGNIDGTYTCTLSGTDFTGATNVTFGGTPATSVSVVNPTTVTCVVPAHAAGVINVAITTPGGSDTLINGFEYFSPAQLSLSAWYLASFEGAPWTASGSIGVSATTGDLVTGGSDPTPGTAQNGYVPASFDGISQFLSNGTTVAGTIWNTNAGTVIALMKPITAGAVGASGGQNVPVLIDTNSDAGLYYDVDGFKAMIYDGAYEIATCAAATGSYHAACARWDGINAGIIVDNAAPVLTGAGTATVMNGTVSVGLNGYGVYPNADVLELITLPTTISDADWVKVRAYFRTRYAVTV